MALSILKNYKEAAYLLMTSLPSYYKEQPIIISGVFLLGFLSLAIFAKKFNCFPFQSGGKASLPKRSLETLRLISENEALTMELEKLKADATHFSSDLSLCKEAIFADRVLKERVEASIRVYEEKCRQAEEAVEQSRVVYAEACEHRRNNEELRAQLSREIEARDSQRQELSRVQREKEKLEEVLRRREAERKKAKEEWNRREAERERLQEEWNRREAEMQEEIKKEGDEKKKLEEMLMGERLETEIQKMEAQRLGALLSERSEQLELIQKDSMVTTEVAPEEQHTASHNDQIHPRKVAPKEYAEIDAPKDEPTNSEEATEEPRVSEEGHKEEQLPDKRSLIFSQVATDDQIAIIHAPEVQGEKSNNDLVVSEGESNSIHRKEEPARPEENPMASNQVPTQTEESGSKTKKKKSKRRN